MGCKNENFFRAKERFPTIFAAARGGLSIRLTTVENEFFFVDQFDGWKSIGNLFERRYVDCC